MSPRVDAERNHSAILAAADAIFAEQGPGASTAQIATMAGVAIGTLFRHFPTKAALVEAVFIERLRRLIDMAGRLVDAKPTGTGFLVFFSEWATLSALKHAFADAMISSGVDVARISRASAYRSVRQDLTAAVLILLRQSQVSGVIRRDIGMEEIDALLIGTARAIESAPQDPKVRRLILSVIADGLRAPMQNS
jgi:AcrR family transcriptional regulator